MTDSNLCLLSGNANPELAAAIGQYLETPLGQCKSRASATARAFVEIDENVRGVDAFVIQPTCSPVNDNVMELLIMVDALRRASAGSITAVIPYYGYARQDRKVAPRTPITSKLVADLLAARRRQPRRLGRSARRPDPGLLQHPLRSPLRDAGVPRGLPEEAASTRRPVFVSPDAGGVERTRAYSKRLDAHARDHRQAPRARERERGDEPHRRGRRARTASSSTT